MPFTFFPKLCSYILILLNFFEVNSGGYVVEILAYPRRNDALDESHIFILLLNIWQLFQK